MQKCIAFSALVLLPVAETTAASAPIVVEDGPMFSEGEGTTRSAIMVDFSSGKGSETFLYKMWNPDGYSGPKYYYPYEIRNNTSSIQYYRVYSMRVAGSPGKGFDTRLYYEDDGEWFSLDDDGDRVKNPGSRMFYGYIGLEANQSIQLRISVYSKYSNNIVFNVVTDQVHAMPMTNSPVGWIYKVLSGYTYGNPK